MNIFDILGPVMVGPSSSHTAGAARIGYITRKLLGSCPQKARIGLSGSFAATGRGHGTDRALVAGLLGMKPDDMRIPDSFQVADQEGLEFEIYNTQLKEAHPNTALLDVTGKDGRTILVQASSLGGGRIMLNELDGITVNCTGACPTLIIRNEDSPGQVIWKESEYCNTAASPGQAGRICGNGDRDRPAGGDGNHSVSGRTGRY